MSGMLHPVGPEPARTYWVRRGILLAVVLLLAAGIVLAVASLTKAAVATAPPPVIAPVDTPTPTLSTSPSASAASPGPATSSAPSASAETGVATPTSPATPGSPVTATPATPTSTTSPTTAGPSSSAASTATAKPTPTVTPDCDPSDLSVTLKGDRTLSPGENNTFNLSLINGGAATCLASVNDQNFELKIYSGTDRIWSSRDCTRALTAIDKKLASQADTAWNMTWNGQRSVAGKNCKSGDTPRPGTYWATAQLKGADPVQLRMIIS